MEKKMNSSERNLQVCNLSKKSKDKILTSPKPRKKQKSVSKSLEKNFNPFSLFLNLLLPRVKNRLTSEAFKSRLMK